MPIDAIRAVVDRWVDAQRLGWLAVADDEEWALPPDGGRWSDHPALNGPVLTASDWQEIEAEAKAGA
jgi:hypothetical protein